MLQLMTPEEYLNSLKEEGYEYFELDDNFYQYEMGKLMLVFGRDVEDAFVSNGFGDFKAQEFPADYLSMRGVTNDYVAYFVAHKERIILLDENNLPMAELTQEQFGNNPSDYKDVTNMMVEYGSPGYYTGRFHQEHRLRKVFHNGKFFYEGYEATTKHSHFTYRFKYLSQYEVDLMYGDFYENTGYKWASPRKNRYETAEEALEALLLHMIGVRKWMKQEDIDPGAATSLFTDVAVSECKTNHLGQVSYGNKIVMMGPYEHGEKMMFTVSSAQKSVFPIDKIVEVCKRTGFHEPTRLNEDMVTDDRFHKTLNSELVSDKYGWKPVGYIPRFEQFLLGNPTVPVAYDTLDTAF